MEVLQTKAASQLLLRRDAGCPIGCFLRLVMFSGSSTFQPSLSGLVGLLRMHQSEIGLKLLRKWIFNHMHCLVS
jgi:hypothetical protein